jgi:ribose transport system ATP-binding protein
MDVARNVYGVNERLPRRGWLQKIDWESVCDEVEKIVARLDVDVPTRASIDFLNLAEQRIVEIVRAVIRRPYFLIVDEVTASLEARASEKALELLMRLRDEEEIGLCFVSHRLDEVRQIADEVTVLRDGEVAGRLGSNPPEDAMVELMLGARSGPGAASEIRDAGAETASAQEEVGGEKDKWALRVQAGKSPTSDVQISFNVRRGEVFGLTGPLGSGPQDAVRMLAGVYPLDEGEVEVGGTPVEIRSPKDAIRLGIAFIPEDRQKEGIVAEQDVATNIFLTSLKRFRNKLSFSRRAMHLAARQHCITLDIKTPSTAAAVKTLSGGNQQKLMMARAFASQANVVCIEEPTHGVDIAAKAQIHRLLRQFAAGGGAVILASTDVKELLNLCDRIAVFRQGEIVGTVSVAQVGAREDVDLYRQEELVNKLMAGLAVAQDLG